MKRTIISLATASLIASSAMAADKGIDFTTTGQAVVYYQTDDTAGDDLFNQKKSSANAGVQLNVNADLANGFTFGTQVSVLGTLGLENNLVNGVMQVADSDQSDTTAGAKNPLNSYAITKFFIAKTIGNTTVKAGRQELPKTLSPLAFSEGWNVFKTTFDAALVVNSDLPNTTVVLAYVDAANSHGKITGLTATGGLSDFDKVSGGAYMLTAQNTSLPMATITGSYYRIVKGNGTGKVIGDALGTTLPGAVDALWFDAKVADKSLPMGLNLGLQGGTISIDAAKTTDTSAFGIKVGAAPIENLKVCAAYTTVNDGTVAVKNVAGAKTPLYTQMVLNQGAISTDNSTFMLKGAYSLGDMGTVVAQTSMTTNNAKNGKDNTEFDLLYKANVAGMNLLTAYVNTKNDGDDVARHVVRVVARYAF